MGVSRTSCDDCVTAPVMQCGRCTITRCAHHVIGHGERCESCERDWREEAPTRRAAKLIFAPPIAILCGGLLFGLLLPISVGVIGAAFMAAFALATAAGAGAGACRAVDRGARALFLRERACGLPPARLLPSPRHR
jgi:hypothetical protein